MTNKSPRHNFTAAPGLIRTKFLGDDMILLTRLSDEKAQELINMEIDSGNSLFYS